MIHFSPRILLPLLVITVVILLFVLLINKTVRQKLIEILTFKKHSVSTWVFLIASYAISIMFICFYIKSENEKLLIKNEAFYQKQTFRKLISELDKKNLKYHPEDGSLSIIKKANRDLNLITQLSKYEAIPYNKLYINCSLHSIAEYWLINIDMRITQLIETNNTFSIFGLPRKTIHKINAISPNEYVMLNFTSVEIKNDINSNEYLVIEFEYGDELSSESKTVKFIYLIKPIGQLSITNELLSRGNKYDSIKSYLSERKMW